MASKIICAQNSSFLCFLRKSSQTDRPADKPSHRDVRTYVQNFLDLTAYIRFTLNQYHYTKYPAAFRIHCSPFSKFMSDTMPCR